MPVIDDDYGFNTLNDIKKEAECLLLKNEIPDKWCSEKNNLVEIKKKCELIVKIIEL